MPEIIARDSLTAWQELSAKGGMELEGRDADLAAKLRTQLCPSAATLEEALQRTSTDDLIRALLDIVHPFADMFRAILDFFKAAGAKQGREQWRITIDEEHLGLKDFESFLKSWHLIDAEIDVPAIDFSGAWELLRASRGLSGLDDSLLTFINDEEAAPTAVADVDDWLRAYARGEYLSFPRSLHPDRVPPELVDAAGIAWAANETIRSVWGNREAMMADYRRPGFRTGDEEGLSPQTIAQNETDFWLGTSVALLGRAQRLSASDLASLGKKLAAAYAPYVRRRIGFRADVESLERILSLPIWQRRHELYAIWIVTEMVNALGGHEIELHHENGQIVFAFRETTVATICSTAPEKRIVAEKRVPIDQPIGEGRTGNVQPDYGIWSGRGQEEVCGLIVEVKHYKKAARSRFREVLVDYARAHPGGIILLVNHGPVGDMTEDIDEATKERCTLLGGLTPRNVAQRDTFKKRVRDHVGEPQRVPDPNPAAAGAGLLIDISGSMSTALQGAGFAQLLQRLVADGIASVALADDRIRHRCAPTDALHAARESVKGDRTDLAASIRELLDAQNPVFVVTDSDGAAGLSAFGEQIAQRRATGLDGLWLVEVRR